MMINFFFAWLSFFLTFALSIVFANPVISKSKWTMTSRYEALPGAKPKDMKISVIDFKKDSKTIATYKPSQEPFGMASENHKIVNGQKYFITGWVLGARLLLLRIFEPSTSLQPLCEVETFGESAQLRIVNNQLEVEVIKFSEIGKPVITKWLSCKPKQ